MSEFFEGLNSCCNYRKISNITFTFYFNNNNIITQIHGCLRASAEVIRLAGLTVNIELIRFFASAVTVSHSGDGYLEGKKKRKILIKANQ